MKKPFLFIVVIFFSTCEMLAQIGIYTEIPQTLFHIDAAKDNNQTGIPSATQVKNDVVVTTIANVGVGTIAPSTKLHIETDIAGKGFRYETPNVSNGAMLLCDATGATYWGQGELKIQQGVLRSTNLDITGANSSANQKLISTSPLSLTSGVWFIAFSIKLSNINTASGLGGIAIRSGNITTSPLIYSKEDIGNQDKEAFVSGSLIYEALANTDLYLFVGCSTSLANPYYDSTSDLNNFSTVLLKPL